MNTMGSHEYRSDKHPLHDRVEELERQNKLMREALKSAAEQEPVGYFYKDHNGVLREALDLRFKSTHTPLYAAPVDQSARIAELEAENEMLRSGSRSNLRLHMQLAAAQAENLKLREALEHCVQWIGSDDFEPSCAVDARTLLATPSDNSALEAMLETERVKVAEACAKVGRYCMSEDDCIANGVYFAAYERGVNDAVSAIEKSAIGKEMK